ncbi:MAG: alpha-L-fucosidase [Fimbriimonadaceae bacterium]
MLATIALMTAMTTHSDHMDWWREAKFGMFVHWGLYAVPAGEWQGRKIGGIGEWIYNSAQAKMGDYEGLQRQFNPTKFDAKQFVGAAKGAGMKYIVITSKHHDGFALFDSAVTEWDVMETPFKRDILLELSKECARQGIKMCFYHSIMDWHHKDYSQRRPWDPRPELGAPDMDRYVAFMKAQLRELLSGKYGKIGILWFDGEWEPAWTHERGVDLYNYVKSLDPDVIVNNRVDKGRGGMAGMSLDGFKGDYGTPEQEIPATGLPGVDWESCMTMNDTWGFKKDDHNWKSTEQLLFNLVDCVSKGGNFLLNVGPTAEGLIPQPSLDRLKEMGGYVRVNAEAIYGAGPSPFARLPYRVTTKPGKLYVHLFGDQQKERLVIPGLSQTVIQRVYPLNDRSNQLRDMNVIWPPDTEYNFDLSSLKPNKVMTTICLEYTGPLRVFVPPLLPNADGVLALHATDAKVHGSTARLEHRTSGADANIGYWTNMDDYVTWVFGLPTKAEYEVLIEYASIQEADDARIEIEFNGSLLGSAKLECELPATGGWDKYVTLRAGSFACPVGGKYTLTVRPVEMKNGFVMNLRRVVLRPIPLSSPGERG